MTRRYAIAAAALIWVACDAGLVGTKDEYGTTIAIDLSALLESGTSAVYTTVIESVNLTVSPLNGSGRLYSSGIDESTTVTFNVRAPAGPVDFEAQVISNNGTLLYRADTSTVVVDDGFQVEMIVRPLTAMMVVTPDTADLRTTFFSFVTIRNPGVDRLPWQSIAPCDNFRCVGVTPTSGIVGVGRTDTIQVGGYSVNGSESLELLLTSGIGDVVLTVITPSELGLPPGGDPPTSAPAHARAPGAAASFPRITPEAPGPDGW